MRTVNDDERWMARALRLASLSLGRTWPNPGVGCVIARAGILLGEGRHQRCGDVHAEIAALADCRQRGNDPTGATVYVSLAPCTRSGRQPPCAPGLIAAKVARVVAAIADPHQDTAAQSFAAAGIAYDVGCLAGAATHIHGGFLSLVRSGRPRFTGKWAMTLDGAIASDSGDSKWISDDEALALSRRRRRAFDAIVIGAHTLRRDDPRLLATHARRHGDDDGPVRVVVTTQGDLPPTAHLWSRAAPTWIIANTMRDDERVRLESAGCRITFGVDGPLAIAAHFSAQGCNEVLVEGGAQLHGVFLRAHLYDRLEIYIGGRTLGGGLPAAVGSGVDRIALGAEWRHEAPPRLLGATTLLRLRRHQA